MSSIAPLSMDQVLLLKGKGRSMARERYQEGWLEEVGKRRKKWMGFFYVYVKQPDGNEKRLRRKKILGLKSEMKRQEAKDALRSLIERETKLADQVKPSPNFTLRWFYENRFLPTRKWKESSAPKTKRHIGMLLIEPFGNRLLSDISRFNLQVHLNGLAETHSVSVVKKFKVYANSILDEALEQDFIQKNPARKLTVPDVSKQTSERIMSQEEITELFNALSGRDRLIMRMFLVLGLRPGELFALRRNDCSQNQVRVDEEVSEEIGNKITSPKSKASAAYVWVPESVQTELDFWLESMEERYPDAFLFPSAKKGVPIRLKQLP